MRNKKKVLHMKRKKSIGIVISIFLLSVAIIIALRHMPSAKTAEILYNGEVILRIDLKTEDIIIIPENEDIIFQVADEKIAFISSTCPDKICVNTGFISKPWQTATCLPNKMTIRLKGNSNKNTIDMVQ